MLAEADAFEPAGERREQAEAALLAALNRAAHRMGGMGARSGSRPEERDRAPRPRPPARPRNRHPRPAGQLDIERW